MASSVLRSRGTPSASVKVWVQATTHGAGAVSRTSSSRQCAISPATSSYAISGSSSRTALYALRARSPRFSSAEMTS